MDTITHSEMRAELKRQVIAAGGVMVFARMHGISHSNLSEALSGRRLISETIAYACGYLAQTSFKKIREAA
ncbi:MAG: hypothetical protein KGL63_06015 [Betaproteobacteria bacterium]|nr:hypothetical protein [Betaproteobacteria bacterium]